jgi:hypothetical protein
VFTFVVANARIRKPERGAQNRTEFRAPTGIVTGFMARQWEPAVGRATAADAFSRPFAALNGKNESG